MEKQGFIRVHRLWIILVPSFLWILYLRWAWPVPSWFHGVPAGEDTYQALTLLLWYTRALPRGDSPFFYPLAFAPQGLSTVSLHYTPFLIGLMLPWSALGGPAFAYNLLGWVAFTIAFGGAYRLTRLLTKEPLASIATGIAYALLNPAYFGMRAFGDHMNLAWGLAFTPWILYELERSRHAGWSPKPLWRAGLWWGLAASGSFYALPLNMPILIVYGTLAFRRGHGRSLLLRTVGLALLLSSPWTGAFLYAKSNEQLQGRPIAWLRWTSTNWRAVFRWNPYHPLQVLYHPPEEGDSPFLGLLLPITALSGILLTQVRRLPTASQPLLLSAAIAAFLATGGVIRWGAPVSIPWPPWLDMLFQALWQAGYHFKPEFFEEPRLPDSWHNLLISPGLALYALLPFWEMVIFPYRFLALTGLGLWVSGAESWSRLARPRIRMAIFSLWMLESLTGPGRWIPWPPTPHPAFATLRAQVPEGLIVDLAAVPQVRIWSSGSILMAPLFHGWPTLSGFEAVDPLWVRWLTGRYGSEILAHPERLSALGVRYALLHILSPTWEEARWPGGRMERLGCFEAPPQPSPWDHPICIYHIPSHGFPQLTNMLLVHGWSGIEPWGIWAERSEAEALWIAPQVSYALLELRAFPICPSPIPQRIEVWLNGIRIGAQQFSSCEEQDLTWEIPARWVRKGTNHLLFRFAYAVSPQTLTGGQNPDPRTLSVGFRRLWIHPVPSLSLRDAPR
jgi:hypothetical protein